MKLKIDLQNKGKLYPMCKSQFAQIDCRMTTCEFNVGGGKCSNISPALTFNPDKTITCWSKRDEDGDK